MAEGTDPVRDDNLDAAHDARGDLPEELSEEEVPAVEDWNAPEAGAAAVDEQVVEDDPNLLGAAARAIEPADGVDVDRPAGASAGAADVAPSDDTTDTGAIDDDTKPGQDAEAPGTVAVHERAAHRIALELKRVEAEVRQLLEGDDTRRKRRLAGTRRWLELEEDIISWRFTGRPDEETLTRLRALVARRHYLLKQLEFQTTVRPTWRTGPS